MFRLIHYPIPRLQASATVVNLIAAAFLVCCANGPFWTAFTAKIGLTATGHIAFLVMTGLSLCMAFNIAFSFFSFSPVHKLFLTTVFCMTAIASYFMGAYGIVVNQHVISDLLETNVHKASQQLTWPLVRHFVLLGVLPSAVLLIHKVSYRPWRRELLVRGSVILGSAVIVAAMIFVNFKEFVLFGRSNIELRMYINPTYPVYSVIKTLKRNWKGNRSEPVKVVAADAKRPANTPRIAVVLVVGESARAEEFSLNGYPRATNPQLSSRDVFSFTEVRSCETGTAESLPCMFSHLGRSQFSVYKAKRYENLLDILQRTGVQVVWRDNNSGSQGIADRIRYEDLTNERDPNMCSADGCYDEILLRDLGERLISNVGEMLIILHQRGSHGPAYYKRSPKNFKQFLPECGHENVLDCDRQSIINEYDNTIVYTDYILGKIIHLLRAQSYATAMLYISDHGESLGENNIYLHGLPYTIAPEQQTHVPMIFWASRSYLREKALDQGLLRERQTDRISHDYLFHTLLGMFNVTTSVYKPELDLFRSVLRPKE